MKWRLGAVVLTAFCLTSASVRGRTLKCPPDSVKVGNACVDKYEASVWLMTDAGLVKKVQQGKIQSAAELAGSSQQGTTSADYAPACPVSGNGCRDSYAVSIPGVTPSRYITWFQAAAACRNAGKRLATNQEWTAAALGTPDGTPCTVNAAGVGTTGPATSACASDVGAIDMVGNAWEWVADWVDNNGAYQNGCTDWTTSAGIAGGDLSCVGGPGGSGYAALPGVLIRGGSWVDAGSSAGVFAVYAGYDPSYSADFIGFRCAR